MTDFQRAKALFPNMPEAVFELWLVHIIEIEGWPFQTTDDFTDSNWRWYFGGISVKTLAGVKWRKEVFPFKWEFFDDHSMGSIAKLNLRHRWKVVQSVALPVDSFERWERCRDYIKENGAFPRPIILLRQGPKFRIVDGHHRCAALSDLMTEGLFLLEPMVIDAWIGE